MGKLYLPHLEFYITNVCNLTCESCRSFNNFNFKGRYEFDEESTQKWADKLHIDNIEILGGEPTLHPHLGEWIVGLRRAWPESKLRVTTNGTYLSKVRNFHDILSENRCDLQISSHGYNLRPLIAEEIFLAFGECKVLPIQRSQQFGVINRVWLETDKGVMIDLQNGNSLQDICFVDNKFTLRKSDAELAHKNCGIRDCHHMIDNRIYKCSVVGLLPKFLEQQEKDTTQLLPYKGLDVDSITQKDIDNLRKAIPHCSVCPESNKYRPIRSVLKKDMKFSMGNL